MTPSTRPDVCGCCDNHCHACDGTGIAPKPTEKPMPDLPPWLTLGATVEIAAPRIGDLHLQHGRVQLIEPRRNANPLVTVDGLPWSRRAPDGIARLDSSLLREPREPHPIVGDVKAALTGESARETWLEIQADVERWLGLEE